jgi:hypothetical protein
VPLLPRLEVRLSLRYGVDDGTKPVHGLAGLPVRRESEPVFFDRLAEPLAGGRNDLAPQSIRSAAGGRCPGRAVEYRLGRDAVPYGLGIRLSRILGGAVVETVLAAPIVVRTPQKCVLKNHVPPRWSAFFHTYCHNIAIEENNTQISFVSTFVEPARNLTIIITLYQYFRWRKGDHPSPRLLRAVTKTT